MCVFVFTWLGDLRLDVSTQTKKVFSSHRIDVVRWKSQMGDSHFFHTWREEKTVIINPSLAFVINKI